MSALLLQARAPVDRFGLKGANAPAWLAAAGIAVPTAANSWVLSGGAEAEEGLLVARLGTGEFFLEDVVGGATLRDLKPTPGAHPPGVYPVLREDAAFRLSGAGQPGAGVLDVLAQVCNVNFADLPWNTQPLVMTSMIGVSVLVVPRMTMAGGAAGAPSYDIRIWCDPTFAHYLGESIGLVVTDCGGHYKGMST